MPQTSIDRHCLLPSIITGVDRAREGDYSIGNWADDCYHESYAVATAIHEPGAENLFIQQHNSPTHQQRVTKEFYDTTGGVDDCFKQQYRQHTRPSIDIDAPSSIDRRPEFGKRTYDRDGNRRFHWKEKDEYGVYRDDQGYARDVDGHVIYVSKDDIRKLMERGSRDEHSYLCLPEHASSFKQTKLVP